ncbi:MAG: DUF1398 family protein [Proteobacteria bacterium]|nr:DUF1398 family protein [Pseudomonadota bacterium]
MRMEEVISTTATSYAGITTFPQVVAKLLGLGVESYRADLICKTSTYYMPNGAHAVAIHPPHDYIVAVEFDGPAVKAAISSIQQGKVSYVEFMHLISRAGVTNYMVYLTGKKAVYYGRSGESHMEHFPSRQE